MPVDISYLKEIPIGWIIAGELDGYENKSLIKDLSLVSEEVEKTIEERLGNENN